MPLASRPPAPPPEFCGRQAELEWLTARLGQHAVVVVSGLPGSGKTSLLAALARQVAPRAKVRWSDCHDAGAQEMLQALEAARHEGALLVVDNLHSLGPEGGRAVVGAASAGVSSGTLLLAAGRELPPFGPLEGAAAARMRLGGLTDPAAAQLLERLLGGAARDLAAERAMAGGHPLALRVLADLAGRGMLPEARSGALLAALASAGFTQTLESVTPQERRALEALVVLAPDGAVDREILELCAGPRVPLAGLIRRCLIEGDDDQGYRLAPAVQLFVASTLADDSRSSWEREIAIAYERNDEPELAHEHHCRSGQADASLSALRALAPDLARQGRYDELLERIDMTERLTGGLPSRPPPEGKTSRGGLVLAPADYSAAGAAPLAMALLRARTLASMGRLKGAVAFVREERDRALSAGDKSAEAALLLCQSDLHRQGGDPQRAIRTAWDALQKAEETNDPSVLLSSLERLSLLHAETGEIDKARALLARSRATAPPGAVRSPSVLAAEGALEERAGRTDEAVRLYSAAFGSATDAVDRARLGVRLAEAAMTSGDLPAAAGMARSALAVARTAGDRGPAAQALALLGSVERVEGRFDEAMGHLEQSLTMAGPDSPDGALALMERGEILRMRGDFRGASRDFGRAMALAARLPSDSTAAANPLPVRALALLAALATDRGEFARASEHYRQALERIREGATGQPVGLLLAGLAAISRGKGEFETAAQLLEQAQRAAGNSPRGSPASMGLGAKVLLEKAALARARGYCRAGLEHATEAADLAQAAGDQPLANRIAIETAGLFRENGDPWKAMQALTPALSAARQMGDRLGHSLCLLELGRCHQERGEYARAARLYRRGLLLARRLDAVQLIARFLNASAHVEADQGRFRVAVQYYRRATHILRGLSDRKELQRTLGGLAEIHRNRGEPAQAFRLVAECLALATSLPDRPGVARALAQLADLHLLAGRRTEALDHQSQSLKIKEELGDVRGIVESLTRLARIHASLGDAQRAEPHLTRAHQLAVEHGLGRNEALLLAARAAAALDAGRLAEAETLAGEALGVASNLEFAEGLARGYRLLGLAAKRRGRIDASQRHLNRSLKYFKRLRKDCEIDELVAEIRSLGRENLEALLALRSEILADAARLEREILERHGKKSVLLMAEIAGYEGTLAEVGVDVAMELMEREDSAIVPKLLAHGGTLVKQAADRVLARFDVADSALKAALAIRATLRSAGEGPIPDVRLALHVCLLAGSSETLQGHAIGLLGRLTALAGPGGLVLSGEVGDLLEETSAARLEPMEGLKLRSGEAPITAYRLEGADEL